jgi:uncharacterized protein
MKLRVEQITPEPREVGFCEAEEEANRRLAGGEVHDFRLCEPIDVHVTHYRAGDELYFAGQLATAAEGTCARCLEEFVFPVKTPFEFVLTPVLPQSTAHELATEDLALSFYRGDEIDLTPLIAEQAILALPTRPLCREDCRGLCPACGANRNVTECGCHQGGGDPRLAVLRDLKARRAS